MLMLGSTLFFAFSLSARCLVAAANSSIAAPYNVTDYVLNLTVHDYRAEYLRKRQSPGFHSPAQEDTMNVQNRLHLATVLLGDDLFALSIDTSSPTTWVVAQNFECTLDFPIPTPAQSSCQPGRKLFNSTESKLVPRIGDKKFLSRYETGVRVGGQWYEGELSIGGVSRNAPKDPIYHRIGVAQWGDWNGHGISSGVLGLAFPRGTKRKYPSILDAVFQQKSIPPIFSLALKRASSDITERGLLSFGGVPNIPTNGPWVQSPISTFKDLPPDMSKWDKRFTTQGYRIEIEGFEITHPSETNARQSMEGALEHLTSSGLVERMKSRKVVAIDSSISRLIVPGPVLSHVAWLLKANHYSTPSNRYIVDCDAKDPRFGIVIGGISFYISKDDLLSPAPEFGNNACALELSPSENGPFVLGDVFLRNVLAVFDFSNAYKPLGRDRHGVVYFVGREKY